MNRILNQVESDTLFLMIDIQDLLHLMINMTCIRCCSFNFLMRILSFVNMSIIIIMNLSNQHQLFSLFRFVLLNLHQLVNHLRHLALRINTHVSFFYSTISFRISMHAHFRHFNLRLCINISKFDIICLDIDHISNRKEFLQEIVATEQNLYNR